MDSVPSRVEDILLALINNSEYDGPIISRVEQILYSFLENSEYIAEPESRVEAILVALKAAGLYDDAVVSRIEKILYSKINGTEYTAEPESRVEELLLEWELIEEKELTGVVPLLFNADGTPLLDYLISGNEEHNGTPTPDNPIMPQGTGERTLNLYNINAKDENNGYVNNSQLSQDGTTSTWGSAEISEYILISGDTTYTFNGIGSYNSPYYGLYDENKQLIGAYRYNGASIIRFTSPNNARYFRFTHIKTATHAMMVEGSYSSSTMPEYEPYGVKIQISSASTTTPVYLGEVQTTRKIKKLVLTGEENITSGHLDVSLFNIPVSDYLKQSTITVISTHYIAQSNVNGWVDVNDKSITFYGNTGSATKTMYIRDSSYSTVADFKSYLAQQYAAGTPVTVWYVLAESETGIINEPLMKIGDYADTLSMEQAGAQIPTVNGSNTLDVLTTVKPSEVYIKYKGR